MSSSARKISNEEWDRHKDLIVELYLAKTLKDVRVEMQSQHGFKASSWQYEVQLKRWNVRKNATRKEWQRYFETNDDRPVTTSPGDGGRIFSPVILSKSTASKKRANRWVGGSGNSSTSRASHFTQPRNGPRLLARMVSNEPHGPETIIEANVQDTRPHIAIAPGLSEDSPMRMDHLFSSMSDTYDAGTRSHADPARALFHNVDELAQSLGLTSWPLPAYSLPVVPDHLSSYPGLDSPGRAIFASTGIPAENNMIFFGMLKEDGFRRELPSGRLEHNLRCEGIDLDQLSGSTVLGGFTATFVARCLSSNNHFTGMTRPTSHLQHFLRKLGCQVPGKSSDLITNDEAFETKFARSLLFSMLNGFAGLSDIPMENILRFLNRFVVNKLLLDILEQCSQYALRTLAENIFRAAIEATDTKVLALLLSRKLVDVNESICRHKGKKYTPIERAAVLRCPKFVKSLIDAGADAKMSPGALIDDLKEYVRDNRHSNSISPDSYETLNLLISAGAAMHPRMMIRVHPSSRSSELDFLIVQNIHPERHQDFFQPDSPWTEQLAPVRYVAREFDDCRATKSMQKVINLCHQSDCDNCLANPGPSLRDAVVDAASRGKLETVRLLFDKADLKADLPRIFISAIKSGSSPLINFILSLGPELDPPAVGKKRRRLYNLMSFKTPIAQAVRYENEGLRRELEDNSCLDHLSEGHRFEALVQAAAEVGNVVYMRNLLACAVTSKKAYRESGAALALALRGGHKDIVQMLLEAGATFSTEMRSWSGSWKSLVETLDQEETRMLHALIASGALEKEMRSYVKQADYSMIVDMAYEYPGLALGHDLERLLPKFITQNALEALKNLLQHVEPRESSLNHCLKMAVKIGHDEMVEYLLDMGANPFMDVVLRAAIADRPDMLPLLLQTERRRRTMPKCIGASVLRSLMGHGAGNTEALDELIGKGVINFTRLEDLFEPEQDSGWRLMNLGYEPSARLTPLGMAIQGVPEEFNPNMATMRRFLDAGADPNGISKYNAQWTKGSALMTGLMVAIETRLEEAVNILLDYGAKVNDRPRIRTTRTALQYAAELGDFDMVRLLLSRDADVNSPASPNGGGTAIQFAAMSGNCNLLAYLLDHGGQLGALPSRIDGMWPLEGAAANGRLDMIRYLWEINVRLVAGGTFLDGFSERYCLRAMNFARENGHFGCRDLISDLSGIAVARLETDEYGAPWIAYSI